MSDDNERDPSAETPPLGQRPDPDLLGSFDAFRVRRAEERAQAEPFPDEYGHHQYEQEQGQRHVPAPPPGEYIAAPGYDTAPGYNTAPGYETTPGYGAAQGYAAMPEIDYGRLPPEQYGEVRIKAARPWRSVAIFGGVVALVVGLGAGVYAALQPSDHAGNASSPLTAVSAPASPNSKAAKGDGKTVTARLTVTAVNADSFTATARGQTVVVHLTSDTRFGTAARPFTRSQLVDGAVVYARLRRQTDGTVVATVIAASSPGASGAASPDATDSPGEAATGA